MSTYRSPEHPTGYQETNSKRRFDRISIYPCRFSEDSVREADGLRLPRDDLLQRKEPVAVRVSGLVPRGSRVSGGRVLLRRKSFGADAGHPVPAAERDSRHESRGTAAESSQHVLHDEASDQIR